MTVDTPIHPPQPSGDTRQPVDNGGTTGTKTRSAPLRGAGRRISVRPEVDLSRPLGIASFATTAAIGNVRLRRL